MIIYVATLTLIAMIIWFWACLDVPQRPTAIPGVRIRHEEEIHLVPSLMGRTVEWTHLVMTEYWQLPPSICFVNGDVARYDYVLLNGDVIEFVPMTQCNMDSIYTLYGQRDGTIITKK